MVERYDGELNLSQQMLQFPREMSMIWNICQYVTTSRVIHRGSFNWLTELKSRMKVQREFVQDLKDHYRISQYEHYRNDLTSLAMGVKFSLEQHQLKISKSTEFFKPIPSQEPNYKNKLTILISFVSELSEYDYEPEQQSKTPQKFCEKVKDVVNYIRNTFGGK